MSETRGIRDASSERLRQAFASLEELAGSGESCPAPQALWASARGDLGRRKQHAIVLHLGDCTACAAAWRLALDLGEGGARENAGAFPFFGLRRFWMPLATAAAVILVAAGVAVQLRLHRRDVEPVFRAEESDWIRPLAGIDAPLPRTDCLLRWEPGPPGTLYDVRVTTEDLEPIGRGRGIDRAEFLVSQESLADVPSGGRILWQVTAHLPGDGSVDSKSFTSEVR